jgi:anti-anti-sigma factor
VEEALDEIAFMASVDGRGRAVVLLTGELDLAGVPRLHSALAGLDGDVELDCSGLEFIDAAGLGAFLKAHEACAARGCKLVVVNPSAAVDRLLRLVELDTVLLVRQVERRLELESDTI